MARFYDTPNLPYRKCHSKSGFNDLSLEEGGGFKVEFGGDGYLQYHPEGGIHGDAYWKICNGVRGVKKYGTNGRVFKPGKVTKRVD